jgi:hypothetical protein
MPYFGIPIRNGLPIGLGSVAGFGVQQFSPADLFSAGEQGAWYDPSDFSTLFQDSAGTTPVTAVEQFVGLMLDKSKGLVLGSELVTNGGPFTNTTGWTASASTLSVVSSALRVTENGVGVNPTVRQSFAVTAGRTYQIVINVTNLNMLNFQVWVGSAYNAADWLDSDSFTTTGTRTLVFRAGGATAFFEVVGTCTAGGTSEYFDIGTISVKELAGNHATQTTSAKRPKLAARYNLLTYSEQFDNAAWTKGRSSVTANANTAPDGTTTADKLVEDTTASNTHFASQAVTTGQGPHVFTVFAKAAERFRFILEHSVSPQPQAVFNVQAGTVVSTSGSPISASITNVGAGWYRCQVVANLTTAGSFRLFLQDNAGNTSYTGDGTSGIYIWGADLRPDSQATGLIGPTYQRVVDAATYDTAGFLPYLAFDGLDDSMSTNSIDPGAVDKAQVFAGVRKLSDATLQTIVQTSVNPDINNGTISLISAIPPTIFQLYWQLRGTTRIDGTITSGFQTPVSGVVTSLFDISQATPATEIIGRINGTQRTLTYSGASDAGTGNFGNYPLFIGANNNASAFFNGWLSSLIVRFGANLSQSQIEATESWVNGKTGAY